jgi:hypothetical protein
MKRFTLNGSAPKSLNEIADEVVLDYARKHPFLDAQQIRDIFVTVCRYVKMAHIVETAAQYNARSYQKSWGRSADEIIIPSGEKLYVANQWRAKFPSDNFFPFQDIVGKMGWGKIV